MFTHEWVWLPNERQDRAGHAAPTRRQNTTHVTVFIINNQPECFLPAYLFGGKLFLIMKLIKKKSSIDVASCSCHVACYISLVVALGNQE